MSINAKDEIVGTPTLPGASEIYPTVMVNGEKYTWLYMGNEIPENSVYYGDINHINRDTPQNDCEFASFFDVTGQIYVVEGEDVVYLKMTTYWLDNKVVLFEKE